MKEKICNWERSLELINNSKYTEMGLMNRYINYNIIYRMVYTINNYLTANCVQSKLEIYWWDERPHDQAGDTFF